jgi:hypothetical protein
MKCTVLGEENNEGKGENAGYLHFLLSSHRFQKPDSSKALRDGIVCLSIKLLDTLHVYHHTIGRTQIYVI